MIFSPSKSNGYSIYHPNQHKKTLPSAHTVYWYVFVRISEHTALISLYSIKWSIFVTETECVYCAVRTGYVSIIQVNFCSCWVKHIHGKTTRFNVEINLLIQVSVSPYIYSYVCLSPTTHLPKGQPTSQPTNQTTNQLIKQPNTQPINQPNNQPQPINRTTTPTITQSTNQQINPPTLTLTYLPVLVLRTKDNPQTDDRRSAKLLRTLQHTLHMAVPHDGLKG